MMAEGEGGGVLGSDSPGLLRKSEDDHLRPASRALATRVQTEKKISTSKENETQTQHDIRHFCPRGWNIPAGFFF